MERPAEELPMNCFQEDEEKLVAASSLSSTLCLDHVEEMQADMLEKARELFRLCDKEEKGFITKFDMQVSRGVPPTSHRGDFLVILSCKSTVT